MTEALTGPSLRAHPCRVSLQAAWTRPMWREAIHETHPYGVDSFSLTNFDQVEEGKGCKDPEKVKAFIEASLNA